MGKTTPWPPLRWLQKGHHHAICGGNVGGPMHMVEPTRTLQYHDGEKWRDVPTVIDPDPSHHYSLQEKPR